jgi:hypothetical protein
MLNYKDKVLQKNKDRIKGLLVPKGEINFS